MRIIRILTCLATACCLFLVANSGFAADLDQDGVEDGVDNCIDVANAQQLDSDADGSGDACDADYNNDGNVDDLDFELISNAFNSGVGMESYHPMFDHNSDGVVDPVDMSAHIALQN